MKILFIVKSTIKHKKDFYLFLEEFKHLQITEHIHVSETHYAGHAIDISIEAADKNYQYIFSVGGDGTLHEVINGLIASCKSAEELPVLVPLPYGTANDFSLSLNIKYTAHKIKELISKEKYIYCDIGKVNFNDKESNIKERYFINMLDCGVGALVVKKINQSNKTFGPKITFLKAIISSLINYVPAQLEIEFNNTSFKQKSLSLIVANSSRFGNGLIIAPNAKMNDGKFNITWIGNVGAKDFMLNMRKLKKGELLTHSQVKYLTADKLTVKPLDMSCEIEADGEYLGYLPVSIELIKNRVRLLA